MANDRSAKSLREALFDELESLRRGETDDKRAKAVAQLAIAMLKSVEVEMAFRDQHAKLAGKELPALGDMSLAGEAAPNDDPPAAPPTPPKVNQNPPRLGAPRMVKGYAHT